MDDVGKSAFETGPSAADSTAWERLEGKAREICAADGYWPDHMDEDGTEMWMLYIEDAKAALKARPTS